MWVVMFCCIVVLYPSPFFLLVFLIVMLCIYAVGACQIHYFWVSLLSFCSRPTTMSNRRWRPVLRTLSICRCGAVVIVSAQSRFALISAQSTFGIVKNQRRCSFMIPHAQPQPPRQTYNRKLHTDVQRIARTAHQKR